MSTVVPPANVASLFEPLKLGPYIARNRIFMSALTRSRSVPTNVPNDLNVEYYRQRAKSSGMIVTEGALIAQQGYALPIFLFLFELRFLTEANGQTRPVSGLKNKSKHGKRLQKPFTKKAV